MSKNNGGDAFPSPGVVLPHGRQQGAYEGMSLRDYFAAKAMQGLINLQNPFAGGGAAGATHCSPTTISRQAYEMADAMIAERAK